MNATATRPTPLPPIFENIPTELHRRTQFVSWRYTWKVDKAGEGKWDKPPLTPAGDYASSTDPETWSTFAETVAAYERGDFSGIGFVVSLRDCYVAVDLDHCVEDGVIADWAQDIIRRLDSYTEISPSGTGIRILLRGFLPPHRNRTAGIEVYASGRYVTLTGHHLEGTPTIIEDRPVELVEWHAEVFGPPPAAMTVPTLPAVPVDLDDAELIERAKAAKNGARFARLWDGDTSDHGGDHSAADLALCDALAFCTGRDVDRMDRLFRQSGLYRAKWERADYRGWTLDKAVAGCQDTYTGSTVRNLRPAAECPPELVGTPSDPCQVVIRQLREEIARLREDVAELKANARAINDLFARPDLTPTDKLNYYALTLDVHAPQNRRTLDAACKVTRAGLAARTGQSIGTAGDAISRLARRGLITKRKQAERGANGMTYDEIYVEVPGETVAATLVYGATAPLEEQSNWGGGKRPPRCPDCGDAGTITRTTVSCQGCGQILADQTTHQAPGSQLTPLSNVGTFPEGQVNPPELAAAAEPAAVLAVLPGSQVNPPLDLGPLWSAQLEDVPLDPAEPLATPNVVISGNPSQSPDHGSPACIECGDALYFYGVKRCDPCRNEWLASGGDS